MATDLLQRAREAVVQVLDQHPAVAALTGRLSQNIVAWGSLADATRPVLAYFVVADGLGPVENARAITVQFAAFAGAGDEALANELVALVPELITASSLAALPAPFALDAFVESWQRRGAAPDPESEAARADLDLTLVAS
jgi:hypothetical protein